MAKKQPRVTVPPRDKNLFEKLADILAEENYCSDCRGQNEHDVCESSPVIDRIIYRLRQEGKR